MWSPSGWSNDRCVSAAPFRSCRAGAPLGRPLGGPMNVAILQVHMHIPDAQSLKDKRRIVRGLLDRVRSQFQVAAAEVDDQDVWQSAVLGFACVSGESKHAREVMSKVLDWIRACPAGSVVEHELETL